VLFHLKERLREDKKKSAVQAKLLFVEGKGYGRQGELNPKE
jgi:hypothetical protein